MSTRLIFFTLAGVLSFVCAIVLLVSGNWLGGLLQIVLTAGMPTLYQASRS